MQIQVNTDSSVDGKETLADHVRDVVGGALDRFSARITRVEVHLSDQNGAKGGTDDKRCTIEARLNGLPPMAVTHDAATLDKAIEGASEKSQRSIGSALGRLKDHG